GVAVRGHAFVFGPPGGRVRDGVVTVLEHPGWCARTDADGAFAIAGFAPGERATFELHHPAQWPILTGTVVVPAGGAERVGFQSPSPAMVRLLAQSVRVTPDPARCQIATTVIAGGFTGYDPGGHGEVGATVTIDPPVPAEAGPIYFRYLGPGAIVPDRALAATSLDGGLVFVNVAPGDYVLTARKDGVRFTRAAVHCRAGALVNAAPPWALQTY
ncbi:MAG: hypothetical protein JWM10_866, partial [Myxococcaceae bacterium]|nr:hypothetical protein [Myxococcaceae bacterium]